MGLHAVQNVGLIISSVTAAICIGRRIGPSSALVLATSTAFLGILLAASGIYLNQYAIIVAGRGLLGLSYEWMNVAQFVITWKMYADFYVNTITSLQSVLLKAGGGVAFLTANKIYDAMFEDFDLVGARQLGSTVLSSKLFFNYIKDVYGVFTKFI